MAECYLKHEYNSALVLISSNIYIYTWIMTHHKNYLNFWWSNNFQTKYCYFLGQKIKKVARIKSNFKIKSSAKWKYLEIFYITRWKFCVSFFYSRCEQSTLYNFHGDLQSYQSFGEFPYILSMCGFVVQQYELSHCISWM